MRIFVCLSECANKYDRAARLHTAIRACFSSAGVRGGLDFYENPEWNFGCCITREISVTCFPILEWMEAIM